MKIWLLCLLIYGGIFIGMASEKLYKEKKNMASRSYRFTQEDLKLWEPYVINYFLEILNGSYSIDEAREDLESLKNN